MSIDVSLVACVTAILLFQYVVSARPSAVAPITGARREDVHLQRKLQHVGTGAMIYVALKVFDRWTSASVLLLFALLCYGLHDWRGRSNTVNAAYIKWFGSILRQHEVLRSALPGAYYFLLGSGLSLAVFPLQTARLTILHVCCVALYEVVLRSHALVCVCGCLMAVVALDWRSCCSVLWNVVWSAQAKDAIRETWWQQVAGRIDWMFWCYSYIYVCGVDGRAGLLS